LESQKITKFPTLVGKGVEGAAYTNKYPHKHTKTHKIMQNTTKSKANSQSSSARRVLRRGDHPQGECCASTRVLQRRVDECVAQDAPHARRAVLVAAHEEKIGCFQKTNGIIVSQFSKENGMNKKL
jgi:hypothetical protein